MTTGSLAYFDRVYVINLPHRGDRRREIAVQLQRVGLSLEQAPLQLFPAVRPDAPGPFTSIGARGCFMSHLGVLRDAERAGHGRIAILEDDVDFVDTFEADFGRVVERLHSEPWDVFYGGHRIEPARPSAPAGDLVETIPGDIGISTTHFVGFSGATIAAMARHLELLLERPAGDPAGGPMHVDGAYSWYRAAHPACRTLVSHRQLAVQRPSRTDIHALKWYDRLPIVRAAAQAVRRMR